MALKSGLERVGFAAYRKQFAVYITAELPGELPQSRADEV